MNLAIEDAINFEPHHLSFLSRTCAEIVLAPTHLRKFTDAVIRTSLLVSPATRMPFWVPASSSDMIADDEPLAILLINTFGENQHYITQHLLRRLEEQITANDSIFPTICFKHRRRFRWDHATWSRTHQLQIEQFSKGVEPLYRSFFFHNTKEFPLAQAFIAEARRINSSSLLVKDIYALVQRLMATETPWLPANQWWSDFAQIEDPSIHSFPRFVTEATNSDLGPQLIVGLPYLETHAAITDSDQIMGLSSVPAAAALVEMRRSQDPSLPLPPHTLPPDILDFLLRRARHEFSVIG